MDTVTVAKVEKNACQVLEALHLVQVWSSLLVDGKTVHLQLTVKLALQRGCLCIASRRRPISSM